MNLDMHLPRLLDDGDIGLERLHAVPRDAQSDFRFIGTLIGAAAPLHASRGRWAEYRIYRTRGSNYVFSNIARSALSDDREQFAARVFFEPTTRCGSWARAAVKFFGHDVLARSLYRKLGAPFREALLR